MIRPGRSLLERLSAPVDVASLAIFRIAFGSILLFEIGRYREHGWIARLFKDPAFHFKYYGFGWLEPWPGNGMDWHMGALAVLAGAVGLGLFYRTAAILSALGFAYVFLLDEARYLNHFYLICLLSFLLIFVSPHRAFSLDALRRPGLRSRTVPAWQLWLLRGQVGLVYIFAGVAKVNPDWLAGEPIRTWLARHTDFPVLGRFFLDETTVYLFAYGGMLLDLLVVPALLWKRTRAGAFLLVVCFHLMNSQLFLIGVFPWLMIAATTLFLDPDWPRRMLHPFRRGPAAARGSPPPAGPLAPAIAVLLAVYFAIQVLVPLRHHLYPGSVAWTDEGDRFSWRMMLRRKKARGHFVTIDKHTGERREIDPSETLADFQARLAMERPDMILQFAKLLADRQRENGEGDAIVHAQIEVSLNGRPFQPFVDPTVDLAAQSRDLGHVEWILPMREFAGVSGRKAEPARTGVD